MVQNSASRKSYKVSFSAPNLPLHVEEMNQEFEITIHKQFTRKFKDLRLEYNGLRLRFPIRLIRFVLMRNLLVHLKVRIWTSDPDVVYSNLGWKKTVSINRIVALASQLSYTMAAKSVSKKQNGLVSKSEQNIVALLLFFTNEKINAKRKIKIKSKM